MKETIKLDEGISARVEGTKVIISKGDKTNMKELFHPLIKISVKDNSIIIESTIDNRKVLKLFNTFKAHINNMIRGLSTPFVYKLKICASHFPISVKVENNDITISNFLGEKTPRKAKVYGGAEVKVEGEVITVSSHNIESAGQTAAGIEKATRVTNRDRRIFQDGIYITKKADKK